MAIFRRTLLCMLAVLSAQAIWAQDNYKRWAVEINGGTTVPYMDIDAEPQYFGQGGIRLNISKLFGIKADYATGVLKGEDFSNVSVENEYFRYGLRGTLNFGEVVKLNSQRFNFMVNAGLGAIHSDIPYSSTFANSDLNYNQVDQQNDYTAQDLYTTVGGRLQIKINQNFAASIGTDYYATQTDLLDGLAPRNAGGNKYDDRYITGYAGLSFYFGGGKEHADWAPARSSPEMRKKTDSNRNAIQDLSDKLKDSDNDGVVDAVDEDNSTKDGVRVSAKGKAMDTDYDGIPDFKDECPVQKGPDSTNGCPADQEVTDSLVEKLRQEVRKRSDRPVARGEDSRQGDSRRRRDADAAGDQRGQRDASQDRQDQRMDDQQARSDRRRSSDDQQGRDRRRRDDQQARGGEDRRAGERNRQQQSAGKSNVEDYPTVNVRSKKSGQISTYYIIGGSFSQKPNAIDFNEFLKSEGFNSKILYVEDRGLFRVSYENFDSQKNATDRLGEIRSQFNDEAWILGN